MKFFAIEQKNKKRGERYYSFRALSVLFIALLVTVFMVISFFAKVNRWTKYESKIDIFSQNMNQIAFYFRMIDKNIAQMLIGIDELSHAYLQGEDIIQTKSKKIDDLVYYIGKNKNYLQSLGFKRYEYLIDLLQKFWQEKDEIKILLGKDAPQNYLVVLQNTNEKKPNGGFFGSFAFVTLDKARITNLEIIDTYYPEYFAKVRVQVPQSDSAILGVKNIGFIGANQYGFTDKDGKNIKDLYEMSFNSYYNQKKLDTLIHPRLHEILLHKYIKGVIFVRLDLFTKYFPQLAKQSKEWQFVNANIDIIRGKKKKDKKEKYIKEANLFFKDNRKSLFRAIANNLQDIVYQRGINIYLSNVSESLQHVLKETHLKTTFSTGNIYFRDTNISRNKADAFVKKNIEIYDREEKLLIESDNDILDIHKLPKGEYSIKLYYSFNRPAEYDKFMNTLAQEYNITMTTREKSILTLAPSVISRDNIPIYRATKSQIYMDKNIVVNDILGDVVNQKKETTSFAKVLGYETYITKNNQTKIIEISITIL